MKPSTLLPLLLSPFLASALPAIDFDKPTHLLGNTFNTLFHKNRLQVTRYSSNTCEAGTKTGERVFLENHTCKTFEEVPFQSFQFRLPGEKKGRRKDMSRCRVTTWTEDGCKGTATDNLFDHDSEHCNDVSGLEGAKSVRVDCGRYADYVFSKGEEEFIVEKGEGAVVDDKGRVVEVEHA